MNTRTMICSAAVLLAVSGGIVEAAADGFDYAAIVEQVFTELPVGEVNAVIGSLHSDMVGAAEPLTFEMLREIMQKGLALDFAGIAQTAVNYVFEELIKNARLMGKLLFLAVLCSMLQNLQTSFSSSDVALLAYSVNFVFVAVLGLTAFYNVMTIALTAINNMVAFMQALLPLLLTLLAGVGAVTTAGLFSPVLLLAISVIASMVKDVILPLLLLGAAIDCANYLTDKYQLHYLTGLFKQYSMVLLGFLMVIFIGIVTIQGLSGSVSDGLFLRSAKFATATFVPVVGKVFADTVELVMGASLLLKNAIGIFGVLTIISLCTLPLVKVFSLVAVMKVTGALVEPLGDSKMAKCLNDMGNNLLLVAGALMTVVLMFFLTIAIIIGAGGLSYMMR